MEREHGLSGNGAQSAGAQGWEEMLEGRSWRWGGDAVSQAEKSALDLPEAPGVGESLPCAPECVSECACVGELQAAWG